VPILFASFFSSIHFGFFLTLFYQEGKDISIKKNFKNAEILGKRRKITNYKILSQSFHMILFKKKTKLIDILIYNLKIKN